VAEVLEGTLTFTPLHDQPDSTAMKTLWKFKGPVLVLLCLLCVIGLFLSALIASHALHTRVAVATERVVIDLATKHGTVVSKVVMPEQFYRVWILLCDLYDALAEIKVSRRCASRHSCVCATCTTTMLPQNVAFVLFHLFLSCTLCVCVCVCVCVWMWVVFSFVFAQDCDVSFQAW